jgi:hypothetical protein
MWGFGIRQGGRISSAFSLGASLRVVSILANLKAPNATGKPLMPEAMSQPNPSAGARLLPAAD